jgi:WD40 repeat protein
VLRYSRDGEYLVSGSEDRTLRVTDLHTGEKFSLETGNAKVMSLQFCGPGLVASGGSDNLIRLWDLKQRKEITQLAGHTGSVAALAYEGEVLVSSGYDATVRIWTRNSNVAGGDRNTEPRVGRLPSISR